MVIRLGRAFSIATMGFALVALGCANFDTPLDPAGGAPDVLVPTPSFSVNVLPIFEKRCSVGGCHSFVTRQAGLSLTADEAYNLLVGVPSSLRPTQLRVQPAQPGQSWLVAMISADDGARQNFSRMPLATQPLTTNQITTIVRWIEQGALRN